MSAKRSREAEEKARRKAVRARFRRLIRTVYLNNFWLRDLSKRILLVEPKKEISMIMRQQRKIGLLTLADKRIIDTHPSLRSVENRKRLISVILELTCFSRIQPKIVARLANVIKFMFVDRGRTLIREGDAASDVYFVLYGELEVSRKVYSNLKRCYVDKVETINGAGDCIGDIELYENCPRRNTYLATTHVELLVITSEDFYRLLYPSMYNQWVDKKLALKTLGYFDAFTEDQIISACKYGVLKQFDPLETIYHEDAGDLSAVHFILSGECMILQCLKMNVTERKSGKKTFQMVAISEGGASLFQHSQKMTDTIEDSEENIDGDSPGHEMKRMDLQSILEACAVMKAKNEKALRDAAEAAAAAKLGPMETKPKKPAQQESEEDLVQNAAGKPTGQPLPANETEEIPNQPNEEGNENVANKVEQNHIDESAPHADAIVNTPNNIHSETISEPMAPGDEVNRESVISDIASIGSQDQAEIMPDISKESGELVVDEASAIRPSTDHIHIITPVPSATSSGSTTESTTTPEVEKRPTWPIRTVENRFIDVGSISFGGIFGLGEKMEHRMIMARTTVQCLTLPRFWLMEKNQNPGNVWQRRRFYLDLTIPSRTALFKDFLATRRWQEFRRTVVTHSLDKACKSNPTRIEDIPIICRLLDTNKD